MDAQHLLRYIIRPVLRDIGLWSEPAERLVLGTACQESQCGRWVRQIGGPALGIYQMEPATYSDLWTNYLKYQPELIEKIWRWQALDDWAPNAADEMVWNLAYATIMCRVHYLRVPDPIPDYLGGQAAYWKKYYNTPAGAGTVQEYMNSWNRHVQPSVLLQEV